MNFLEKIKRNMCDSEINYMKESFKDRGYSKEYYYKAGIDDGVQYVMECIDKLSVKPVKPTTSAVPLDKLVICPFCGDKGVVDSGGTTPWGTPIDIDCGCCEGKKYMSFGFAIEAMKKGKRVARKGWNGKGIFCELQTPDDNSKMSSPYIYIDTTGLQTDNPDAPKSLVPWLASQTDMLADDWQIVG